METIDTHIEEFNTSESYFGHILFGQCNLVVPYVSIEISHHFINPSRKPKFIDKAYYIFEGALSLNIDFSINNNGNVEDYQLCEMKNDLTKFYIGGNSFYKKTHTEMSIVAQKRYVQFLDETKIADERWIPENYAHFKANMEDSIEFLSNSKIPSNIQNLIGKNFKTIW